MSQGLGDVAACIGPLMPEPLEKKVHIVLTLFKASHFGLSDLFKSFYICLFSLGIIVRFHFLLLK